MVYYNCFRSFVLLTFFVAIANGARTGNSIEDHDDSNDIIEKDVGILEKLRQRIREKEKELYDAERINKNFEKMIQLVNILGQVDTFLTDRTKIVLRKLAMLADDMDAKSAGGKQYNIKF